MMAEKPKMIIISLKKGKRVTMSFPVTEGVSASILLNKINNKKQILQIKATLEKNEINFIKVYVLKILSTK